jgi:hypothetical protein
MEPPVDISKLPGPAQKILDPGAPPPLRQLAARGLAPGLKPAEALTVACLHAETSDTKIAEVARQALAKLPPPLLNGALAGDLPPGVLDLIAPHYASDDAIMQRVLMHPLIAPATVAKIAATSSEAVSELIATNEERLLKFPAIIEKLYLNDNTRMSTASRVIELAVRNGLELTGIPAFKEAAAAIADELIAEPTEAPTPGDEAFKEVMAQADLAKVDPNEEVHVVDHDGKEVVKEQHVVTAQMLAEMTSSEKIRFLSTRRCKSVHRALLVRDGDRRVACAVVRGKIGESEAIRYAMSRAICDDVLRILADSEFVRNNAMKYALVENPRTPFSVATRFVPLLRDSELRKLAYSKSVSGAIQQACMQHLSKKEKQDPRKGKRF